jgi:hypothetical protein
MSRNPNRISSINPVIVRADTKITARTNPTFNKFHAYGCAPHTQPPPHLEKCRSVLILR